jgi:hypothetical protein
MDHHHGTENCSDDFPKILGQKKYLFVSGDLIDPKFIL